MDNKLDYHEVNSQIVSSICIDVITSILYNIAIVIQYMKYITEIFDSRYDSLSDNNNPGGLAINSLQIALLLKDNFIWVMASRELELILTSSPPIHLFRSQILPCHYFWQHFRNVRITYKWINQDFTETTIGVWDYLYFFLSLLL